MVVSACASTSTAATVPAAATQTPDVIDIRLAYSPQSKQDGLNQAGAHYVVDSLADVAPVLEDIQARLTQGEQP